MDVGLLRVGIMTGTQISISITLGLFLIVGLIVLLIVRPIDTPKRPNDQWPLR
jgi:hypothetical protein